MPQTSQEACTVGACQFLQSWPLTLTTKPSTSKLSDNPALDPLPPQTLRPLEPLLHGCWPCFITEIFHVTPASKLNDSPANI